MKDLSFGTKLQTLLAAAQKDGDQKAYRAFLESVQRLVKPLVLARVRTVAMAEEIVQEILLKVHCYRDTYDSAQPIIPWLKSIARNTIIDELRKLQRRIQTQAADAVSEAQVAGDAEVRLLFEQAMSALSADELAVIGMLKLEGLSLEEASARTSDSVSALKVRAHRAYKKLLSGLEEG